MLRAMMASTTTACTCLATVCSTDEPWRMWVAPRFHFLVRSALLRNISTRPAAQCSSIVRPPDSLEGWIRSGLSCTRGAGRGNK